MAWRSADDKIVAVLENAYFYGAMDGISDLQEILIERLRHYFGTYKMIPGQESQMVVEAVYGRDHALKVVRAASEDYEEAFC